MFHGSATGLSLTQNWTAETNAFADQFGSTVSSAGDVNGDGYSDVIVGTMTVGKVRVFHGSSTGLSPTPANSYTGGSQFGTSVACAGDVNADGYSDVVIGSPVGTQALVYYGSASGLPGTASWTISVSVGFGFSVASAGDVNGDGYSDVIVGNNLNQVWAYHGSASGLPGTHNWTRSSSGNLGNCFESDFDRRQ